MRSFLDLHKKSEFGSALQGAAGKILLRAGTGLPGLCAERDTLLSPCCACAQGCATCSQVCLLLLNMCQAWLLGLVCEQWPGPTWHTSPELGEGHQGAAVAQRWEWALL